MHALLWVHNAALFAAAAGGFLPWSAQAATPREQETNSLPIYEIQISKEEWMKLQRNPRSDERHAAKFRSDGKEYAVGLRYRGDWARSWPKKPLKIFFEKDHAFDGRHVVNLNSCWRDPGFVREHLAYQIYAACATPCSRTRMVRVHLNGRFYGLFVEVEQPAKTLLQRSNLRGATIYKASSHAHRSDESDLGREQSYHAHYEKENHESEDYSDLQKFCHDLATSRNAVEFFVKNVDVRAYVNYLAATALVQNWDCFNKNHFIVHDAKGSKKWSMIPWDLDRTFGDHWHGGFTEARLPLIQGTSARPGPTGWNKMYEAFYKEPVLRLRLLDRLDELLQNEFTKEKLFPLLDRLESEISADAALDRQRWPNGNAGDLHEGIAEVKRYIEDRRAFLLREVKSERGKIRR